MTFPTVVIGVITVLVIISEIYKGTFEKESKDERGQFINYKVKSFSYSILTVGIILGVVLVALFEIIDREYFIFYVILVFFLQSIASSIYLAVSRRI